MDANYKLYHLVKPTEHGPNEGQEKMVTEIYLTRYEMNELFDGYPILLDC